MNGSYPPSPTPPHPPVTTPPPPHPPIPTSPPAHPPPPIPTSPLTYLPTSHR